MAALSMANPVPVAVIFELCPLFPVGVVVPFGYIARTD